jgi:hypothetical protein
MPLPCRFALMHSPLQGAHKRVDSVIDLYVSVNNAPYEKHHGKQIVVTLSRQLTESTVRNFEERSLRRITPIY